MTLAKQNDFALLPEIAVDQRPAAETAEHTVSLFGLDVVSQPTQTVIDRLLTPGRRSRIAFFNAHCGNVMARDADYADALMTADEVLPDGIGVELAARMSGASIAENLNGTDFTPALLKRAAEKGLSVFLLGARPGVAEAAAKRLCLDIPGLRIVGTRDGYEGMTDEAATVRAVNLARPDILLVAAGVPMQDLWIARNAHRLHPRICLGVGALFDFLAGRVRRAPLWVRRARCEWVWRLASEPHRMARRYLIGNATFLARSAWAAIARKDKSDAFARSMDVLLAGAALLLLSPFALLVAAAIRIDSQGPVFFRQERVGKDGKHFFMLKFRSMHVNAEERRADLLACSDREGVCFKSKSDPRITAVGRFLRRYSIDELPQIWNVLRGDMSIVGPRPALPSEVAAYPARAFERLICKPGLTGVWQVSGRAEIGFDKMIDMDIAYVRSRSALLNVILIALTFRAVLGGRGAY